MADNLPMLRPVCGPHPEHGFMTLRQNPAPLDLWCGTWYDCVSCLSSEVLMSPELMAQLAEQEKTAARTPNYKA